MAVKHYFLNRHKEFVEVELLQTHGKRRIIKILEGKGKGKTKAIHPEGQAWGKIYPRLFTADKKPSDFFVFKGRVLMKFKDSDCVPTVDPYYRFQPFLTHVIDSVNSRDNLLLTGGTGVGKTTHIEQLAARCNQSLLRVNFNGETRLSDFIGKLQVVKGETRWVDGILPMAMRKGMWLLLDEIDFADPSVLSLLHPVLEENPMLVLKENQGEVIRPHPNFRVFATANSIGGMADRAATYTGTNAMNEAFLNRWQILMVPSLPMDEEIQVLKTKVKAIKNRWAKRIVEFAEKVRSRQVDGINFSSDNLFSTRVVLSWAKKTALHQSPIEGARLAWLDRLPSSEHEAVVKILELHFGNQKRERPFKKAAVPDGGAAVPKRRGRPPGSKNKKKK